MAWDDEAKRVAINVIGTVESNLRYDAINYSDPITVGFAQWYGTRAANLLNQIRGTPAWVGVASSLTNSLENNAENNASYWTSRHLSRDEGRSLSGPLTSPTGVQIQNEQFIEDLEAYRIQASNRGLNSETHTPSFIYYAQLYHQSPLNANRVLNAAGTNPSVSRLDSLARNNSWYSRFPTRLNTALRIINDWDSDIPGTFEPSDGEEGGDIDPDPADSSGGSRIPSIINHVESVGNQLIVHTRDGKVVCLPSPTGQLWHPQRGLGRGPEIAEPTPEPVDPAQPPPIDPGSTAATQAAALRQFLLDRTDKYRYRQQNPGRYHPDDSGYTDCSGLMRYTFRQVVGVDIGTYTVPQSSTGTRVFSNIAPTRRPGILPQESNLRVGDLLFFANDRNFSRVRHVEMYIGNSQLTGWGGPTRGNGDRQYGPYVKSFASYVAYWRWHEVRRILQW